MSNYTLALRDLLEKYYPLSNLDDPETIGGDIFLRFELGDRLPNGTEERVHQAYNRAFTLFQHCFEDSQELFLLIYDYDQEVWTTHTERDGYLYTLLSEQNIQNWETELISKLNAFEGDDAPIYFYRKIGKANKKQLALKAIFQGLANKDMGFSPSISQEIFFIDPKTHHIFYMYDDRACLIFSPRTESVETLFLTYNDWLVDEIRDEVNAIFEYLLS